MASPRASFFSMAENSTAPQRHAQTALDNNQTLIKVTAEVDGDISVDGVESVHRQRVP